MELKSALTNLKLCFKATYISCISDFLAYSFKTVDATMGHVIFLTVYLRIKDLQISLGLSVVMVPRLFSTEYQPQ